MPPAPARATWTDERLDDLSSRVDAGFARMDQGFARVDARIDSMQRTMIQVGGGIIASILVAAAGIAATQL
jgi:hypothetical protein